ncbi:MAG: hypothetical protein WA747_11000 [Steroidobacteraceae bacterium]
MRWIYALVLALPLQWAWAQQTPVAQPAPGAARPAPQSMPSPEEVNPAVDTTPAGTPQPAAAAPAAAPAPDSKGQGKSSARGPSSASPDRVELGTTDITGNRELPKVLYIVPWKRADLGDLVGKPPNSLLDEVLQPIDRDVFLRENRYYDALQPGRARAGGGSVQGSGDKPVP